MNRAETEQWLSQSAVCECDLRGRDIVVLSHQRWNSHFTPIQGTTLRLAQHNRVLYMEPPDSMARLRHDRAARGSLRRFFNRMDRFGSSFGVYFVPPIFLPFQPYSRRIMRSIERSYVRMVRDGMRRMGLENPIIWAYQFNAARIIDALSPPAAVYECVEEAAGFTSNARKKRHVREMDEQLCRRADVVFVANAQMYAARAGTARNLHVVPWPVDFEHYNRAMQPHLEIPEDIRAISRPIIGFYGVMDGCRMDVDLLEKLAVRRADWSLVLIGGSLPGFDPAPLERLSNVHFLGSKPMTSLPAYVKGFDVAIVPYALNEFTRSITPLKMMEYLATGKPVVMSPIPSAQEHARVLRFATTAEEFEAQIEAALANPDEGQSGRVELARANNWDQYMRRKTGAVAAVLDGKKAAAKPFAEAVVR